MKFIKMKANQSHKREVWSILNARRSGHRDAQMSSRWAETIRRKTRRGRCKVGSRTATSEKWETQKSKKKTAAVIGKFQGSREASRAVDVDLGDAKTDEVGRLIFVGGSGWAECVTQDTGYKPDAEYPRQPDIMSEFDNPDWVDSSCDGRISVVFSKGDSPK